MSNKVKPPKVVPKEPRKPESSSQIVAPKPHRVTILLGALSPLLALVAVGFSCENLRRSDEALKIAQRAYLAFVTSSFKVTPEADGKHLRVSVTQRIKNVGNTPAYLDNGQSTLDSTDSSTHVVASPIAGTLLPMGVAIAPKDEISGFNPIASLTEKEATCIPESCNVIKFHGYIKWHDMFGQSHTDAWCTSLFRASDSDIRTDTCTPEPPKEPTKPSDNFLPFFVQNLLFN